MTGDLALEIVPVGGADPAVIRWLAAELRALLPLRAELAARPLAPRPEWSGPDPHRWSADRVLDSLEEWHHARGADPEREWILGVTDTGLAAPDRPFAFGISSIGGCCALISLARLRDGDGAVADALFRTRILKEAVHELGHLAGLDHCDRTGCVMFPSPDLPATDRKGAEPCPRCRRGAGGRLGGP